MESLPKENSKHELMYLLKSEISELLSIPTESITNDMDLVEDLGLESIDFALISDEIKEKLEIDIDPLTNMSSFSKISIETLVEELTKNG